MGKHPGSIDRHGNRWRLRMSVGGRRHIFWMDGDSTREDVEQHAREKHAELHDRHGKGLPGPMPVSELFRRYREEELPDLAPNSQKAYGTTLQAAETYFVRQGGDPKAHEVRPGHINGFMNWRKRHAPNGERRVRPVSARTINKDRAVLRVIFAFAEMEDIVEVNPVRKTKQKKGDKREAVILSREDYEALVAACDGRPMLRTYVLVLGETGVRCDSEGLHLKWVDIDLEEGFLHIRSGRDDHRTKTGKSRWVPMTDRLRDAMREHMATYRLRTYHGKRSPWVFHHEVDRRRSKAGDRLGSLRRAFAGAVKRAGVDPNLRQHDLRHRRVTTWIAEGHDSSIIQDAMGHASISTTMAYKKLARKHLKALVSPPRPAAELKELAGR
jgi:integrase